MKLISSLLLLFIASFSFAETWQGLTVKPENRCSKYNSKDYHYPQSVELEVISSMNGRVYSPYDGITYADRYQTDIEHIVARSEAHDSGLCNASSSLKAQFAQDVLNLTLSPPDINRRDKKAKDAAQWLPQYNQCWFVARIIAVKQKYNLSIDRAERDALEKVISNCDSTKMVFYKNTNQSKKRKAKAASNDPILKKYDDNKNGRITCKEARRHGIAPVKRSHPAYKFMHDGDNDGTVCE